MPEKEYIEREAVKALIKDEEILGLQLCMPEEWRTHYAAGLYRARYILEKAPAADVAEVKHGHIIEHQGHEDEYYCECSVCESKEVYIGDKYCSECGAKLDGKG